VRKRTFEGEFSVIDHSTWEIEVKGLSKPKELEQCRKLWISETETGWGRFAAYFVMLLFN
jgi:hypothetical protein